MPEITREEVRAWLESTARLSSTDRRMARAALAALEDVERVEWIERQIETERGATLYHGLGYCELEHQNGCEIAPTVRAAIDRARGVTVSEGEGRET